MSVFQYSVSFFLTQCVDWVLTLCFVYLQFIYIKYVIIRLVSKDPQKNVATLSSIFHTKYLQYVHSKISKSICMRYTDNSIYYLFYGCFGHLGWNFLRTLYLDSVLKKICLVIFAIFANFSVKNAHETDKKNKTKCSL